MKKLSLLLLALIFIWSCGSDSDNGPAPVPIPEPTIEPTDPNAVSAEMGADNSTWVEQTGAVPPTNGVIAIGSTADNDTISATNGLPISIDINVALGDSLSLFFGIDGANAHYEVPADPLGKTGLFPRTSTKSNGLFDGRLIKRNMEDARSGSNPPGYLFVFNIPSSIKPGTFCVRFSVTNGSGDISNYITFCVTLQQRGGAGTGNLTARRWKASMEQDYDQFDNPIGDPDIFGVLDTQTDTLWCLNPPPDFEIVIFAEVTQNIFLRFKADGTALIESMASFRFLDFSSECGNLSYIDDNFEINFDGGWSYDDQTKIMTLSINGYYDPIDGFYIEPEVIIIEVITNTPTKIEVKFIEDSIQGEYSILTLVPA